MDAINTVVIVVEFSSASNEFQKKPLCSVQIPLSSKSIIVNSCDVFTICYAIMC